MHRLSIDADESPSRSNATSPVFREASSTSFWAGSSPVAWYFNKQIFENDVNDSLKLHPFTNRFFNNLEVESYFHLHDTSSHLPRFRFVSICAIIASLIFEIVFLIQSFSSSSSTASATGNSGSSDTSVAIEKQRFMSSMVAVSLLQIVNIITFVAFTWFILSQACNSSKQILNHRILLLGYLHGVHYLPF